MTSNPKILVTSAAGKTGLPVTLELLERGYPVRAFVRRMDDRATRLEAAGAEIFVGNQYDINDMRRAMEGTRRAYHCAPTAPNGLHFSAVFAVAAHEARLEHTVILGQWLKSASHPSMFTREVYLADHLQRLVPGMTVTHVDPGWFADNYLMALNMVAHLGLFTMPLGPGDAKRNAPPSNEDIARVAVAALIDPAAHAGQHYRPTGPDLMSPDDIAAAMGRALGRKVRYMNVSEKMMTKALRANPPSNYSEAAVSQLAIYADEYRRGAFAVNAPTQDVQTLAHQPAEPFESIVRRYVAAQPDLQPSLSGRLSAMLKFLKIVVTPALDLNRVKRDRDYVELARPAFCQDDDTWLETHMPATDRYLRSA